MGRGLVDVFTCLFSFVRDIDLGAVSRPNSAGRGSSVVSSLHSTWELGLGSRSQVEFLLDVSFAKETFSSRQNRALSRKEMIAPSWRNAGPIMPSVGIGKLSGTTKNSTGLPKRLNVVDPRVETVFAVIPDISKIFDRSNVARGCRLPILTTFGSAPVHREMLSMPQFRPHIIQLHRGRDRC